jgi:hypothetical protein
MALERAARFEPAQKLMHIWTACQSSWTEIRTRKGMSMRFPKATSCREQTKHTWYSFKCHGQGWKKGCQRPDENLPYLHQCKELGASSFLTRQGHPLFGAAQSGSRLLAVNPIAKKIISIICHSVIEHCSV